MRKSFTQFLVSEGVLSSEDLVKAFIRQSEASPTLPQLIKENGILTDDEILQVYAHQKDHEVSFEQSCIDLNIWNVDLENKIEGLAVREIPSIFKSLIDDDLISLEKITVKLDEYISIVIEDPEGFGLKSA